MGIHVGAVEERDGDYFGPALNRAARLMGMAHGGQILVSNVVAGLLRDHAPADITTRDLGVHHLRGLHEPEQLHQLCAPGLRSGFPSIASPDTNGNLPQPATSFIGRVQELKALGAELDAASSGHADRPRWGRQDPPGRRGRRGRPERSSRAACGSWSSPP